MKKIKKIYLISKNKIEYYGKNTIVAVDFYTM